jgi:hypothetical protein
MEQNSAIPPVAPQMPPASPVVPEPIVPVQPVPTPLPAPVAPAGTMQTGGVTGGKPGFISQIFEGVTFTDVGMLILGSASMFLVIHYYRERIKTIKEEKSKTLATVEELQANVQSFLGANYQKFN